MENDGDHSQEHEVEVFEENWNTVSVFMRCQPTWVSAGLAGARYGGISAMEVEAVCRLQQLPPEEWPRICEGIGVMAVVAAEMHRNK